MSELKKWRINNEISVHFFDSNGNTQPVGPYLVRVPVFFQDKTILVKAKELDINIFRNYTSYFYIYIFKTTRIMGTSELMYAVHVKSCEINNVSFSDSLKKSSKGELVQARQMTCYVLRNIGINISFDTIGSFLNIDHATVMYSVKSAKNHSDTELDYRDKILNLSNFAMSSMTQNCNNKNSISEVRLKILNIIKTDNIEKLKLDLSDLLKEI